MFSWRCKKNYTFILLNNCCTTYFDACFIDYGYEIKENSWCSPLRKPFYPTLSEAKHQCSYDPSCSMFYDAARTGTKFVLCWGDEKIKSSSKGSILYIKTGE